MNGVLGGRYNFRSYERRRPYAVETPGGGLLLTTLDPEVEDQIRLWGELMNEYRESFRALAK